MRSGFNKNAQSQQEAEANGFRDQEAAQGHEQAQAQEAPEEGPVQQVSALSRGGAPQTASYVVWLRRAGETAACY